jgi:hypothetical protein
MALIPWLGSTTRNRPFGSVRVLVKISEQATADRARSTPR